jgi:hypothetical protein
MSHFSVLVAVPRDCDPFSNYNTLYRLLAPFNEQGDPHDEFMEFDDREAEFLDEYENGSTIRIAMPDGRLLLPWDDEFCKDDDMKGLFTGYSHEVPEQLEQRDVPHKQVYPTLEEYVARWHSQSARPYGYWSNPQARWDWWVVGGRWTGSLPLKEGFTKDQQTIGDGHHGTCSEPNDDPRSCDYAPSKAIDWQALITLQAQRAGDKWEGHQEYKRLLAAGQDEEAKQLAYEKGLWRDKALEEDPTRDAYVLAKSHEAVTFAFVTAEGEWNERGSMGWWAIVTDEHPEYDEVFWQWVEQLDDDQMVVVVDCHI